MKTFKKQESTTRKHEKTTKHKKTPREPRGLNFARIHQKKTRKQEHTARKYEKTRKREKTLANKKTRLGNTRKQENE